MRRTAILIATVFFALAGCGQSETARENLAKAGEQPEHDEREIVVGGIEVPGPGGREIEVPRATAEREAVEEYLEEVQPVIERSARDLSGVIEPRGRMEDQTLTLRIEVGPMQQGRETTREGLRRLRGIDPPEELEPVHERLVNAYEEATSAYDDIVEAFNDRNADRLSRVAPESLPEIERATAEARAILQELQRAASQGSEEERSGPGPERRG